MTVNPGSIVEHSLNIYIYIGEVQEFRIIKDSYTDLI
jgi:hypothetical protein